MLSISVKEFLFWKKTQLSKGGDHQSLALLLDSVGCISNSDLNLSRIKSKDHLFLKKNLDLLGSIWEDHLLNSTPIQYLCGITFWRDLKLKVTNKVLIPRPENWRLACQTLIKSSAVILTKPQSPPSNLEELKRISENKKLPR